MKKAFPCAICAVLIAFSLIGCMGGSSAKLGVIRYDVAEAALNLDPQFATGSTERLIIGNICEGLLTRDENGELIGGAAEAFDISPNGLTLTFKLKSEAEWSGGKRVNAEDFVFAFKRMFDSSAPSPFAWEYSAIENADSILSGDMPPERLGVTAKGQFELEIRLEYDSPYFPGNLAETPSMPCKEDFFAESRGRYGLEEQFVYANGPYTLDKWDNESGISLKINPDYKNGDAAACDVNLYIESEGEKLSRFTQGLTDMAELPAAKAAGLGGESHTAHEFESRAWCVVFNSSSKLWGNPLLRQALSLTSDRAGFLGQLPPQYSATEFIVSPSNTLAFRPYRESSSASPVPLDPEQGKRLLEMGMQSLGLEGALTGTIFVPEGPENIFAINVLQQSWEKNLSAYINVESMPFDEVYNKFSSGELDMAFLPLASLTPEAVSVFALFLDQGGYNPVGYENHLFLDSINMIHSARRIEDIFLEAARAESLLLHDAVIIPVFTEKTVLALAPDIEGINATPFPSELRFRYATKKK